MSFSYVDLHNAETLIAPLAAVYREKEKTKELQLDSHQLAGPSTSNFSKMIEEIIMIMVNHTTDTNRTYLKSYKGSEDL